jgi:hypothetical protein
MPMFNSYFLITYVATSTYYAECGEAPPYYIRITAFWVHGHLLVKYNAAILGKRQVHSSKTLVPADCNLNIKHHEILKSHCNTSFSTIFITVSDRQELSGQPVHWTLHNLTVLVTQPFSKSENGTWTAWFFSGSSCIMIPLLSKKYYVQGWYFGTGRLTGCHVPPPQKYAICSTSFQVIRTCL